MALPPDFPDYSDVDVALETMREFVVKGTNDQLTRRLYETQCQNAAGMWFFRPYFAAARALNSNPRWLSKAEGAEWRDLDHTLSTLANEQAAQDVTLGLLVPSHLDPFPASEVSEQVYSGPVRAVFRL